MAEAFGALTKLVFQANLCPESVIGPQMPCK